MVSTILDSMLKPATDQMPPDFASKLLELRAGPELLTRIEELRSKANSGLLSADEQIEYRDFVEAIDIISLLQSKARKILAGEK
jgi:biopolymer transport protein ExbD